MGVAPATVPCMPERIEAWWARRQFSRGAAVPYEIGAYRAAWAAYPVLIRQFHPELNAGITLTQIPPAADVLLLWECEAGHRFVATPTEQRHRPGRERRRSAWCPDCRDLAQPRRVVPSAPPTAPTTDAVPRPPRATAGDRGARPAARRGAVRAVCEKTPDVSPGTPFQSVCAPRPASAVEAQLRHDLFSRLGVTTGLTAVRVGRPFFGHVEVWPDILLPELRVAIEYDSTGRFGLEHVGGREDADRRKDALLRATGWEVVRIRTGRLEPLGPHDVQLSSLGRRGLDRIVDALRGIRGPLLVDAYLR